jgi:hypothetical protein
MRPPSGSHRRVEASVREADFRQTVPKTVHAADWCPLSASAERGDPSSALSAEVMKTLLEFGQTATPERVEEAIRAKLARKEKISGFGHRVYRTEDPRATYPASVDPAACGLRGTAYPQRFVPLEQR